MSGKCRTVSFEGAMQVDIADVAILEDSGTLDGVILHEMGHVIGVGTLWGDGLGGCTTCCTDGNPAWSCPAALSAFYDLGGSAANILAIHQDGETGATCGHLDEAIFYDEVMTGHVNSVMYLSKMTAAVLEDIKYIVDSNAVDPYTIPSQRDPRVRDESTPSLALTDIAVGTTLFAMDGNGTIVEEVSGITMKF